MTETQNKYLRDSLTLAKALILVTRLNCDDGRLDTIIALISDIIDELGDERNEQE